MSSFFTAFRNNRAFKALHYRDFRTVSVCQIFGNLGFWMDELSRGWLIYQITNSMVQLGLARGIQFVPLLLFAPFAGTFADRYSRRSLLLFAQGMSTLIFAVLAVLIYAHVVEPWHVYVAAVCSGLMQVIQQPARSSLVSDTVPPELLTNAIGLTSMIFNGARLIGPALAGAIIAFSDTGGAYAVQAFCLFIATVWAVKLRGVPRSAEFKAQMERESYVESILKGWRYAWNHQTVRAGILCTTAVSLFIFPFTTLLPVFARDILDVGAGGQGILLAAMGSGAVVSSIMITLTGHRWTRGKVMLDASLIYGLMAVGLACSPWYWMALLFMFLAGLCHVHANALVHTVVQTYSAPEYRGRSMALFNMSQMLSTAGSMVIGLLAAAIGPRGAVAAMGLTGAAGILLLIVLMPAARRIK
jgi:MFS family permease